MSAAAADRTAARTAADRIAVTPRSLSGSGHPSLGKLEAAGYELVYPAPGRVPTRAELVAMLPGCVGYLAGTEPIDDELLARTPGLRVISRNGVGVDAIDLAAAARRGVAVETAPATNSQGVAELAISLMLATARHVPWHDAELKHHGWARTQGIELAGRTLGVVGCGQIGQRVTRMAIGLGMRVIAFDAYPSPSFAPPGAFAWGTLAEVLGRSDVVTLHAPGSGDGPLVDTAALASMRPGAVLVNTARASLVDLDAVRTALEDGRLGGFATDVFQTEPPAPHPVFEHQRVVLTPHLGGYTEESVDRAAEAAVDNLLRVLHAHR